MWRFSAFKQGDGWLAWEDELLQMGVFCGIDGNVREKALRDLPKRDARSDEHIIDGHIFNRWVSWGVRDGVVCVQVRFRYVGEVTPNNGLQQATLPVH